MVFLKKWEKQCLYDRKELATMKGLRVIGLILVLSLIVGFGTGIYKALYDKAHEPVVELTAEDALQMLNKDIQKNVEYYVKSNPIEGELPENLVNSQEHSSKEVIAMFLLDVSGSMKTKSENKLVKVQEAIVDALPYIGSNHYIGMISYSTDVTVNVPIARFDENQARKIVGEVENLSASGGTHMYEAIAVGMKLVEEVKDEHPNATVELFVLSDGQPSDDAKKLDFVESYIRLLKIPVYTIGYGKDIDKVELKKLASINEATFSYVEKEDVAETFQTLFSQNF